MFLLVIKIKKDQFFEDKSVYISQWLMSTVQKYIGVDNS